MRLRKGRWGKAVLVTAVAMVLVGPGADGPGRVRRAGDKPAFTLRRHEPYTIGREYHASIPRLTPAFGNTGHVPAPFGVVMRITLTGAVFDAIPFHRNCYYAKDRREVFCEFPHAVPAGAGYETAEPMEDVFGPAAVMGAYRYSVWALGDPPAHTEDYKAHYTRGKGPALGLEPVPVSTLKGGGELRFVTAGYTDKADWAITGTTIRGRIGEYAEASVPQPLHSGPGPQRVRVEVPKGTTFAPFSPAEKRNLVSDTEFCERDERDGNVYCDGVRDNLLRVRIDRRVEGAEGRLSVPEPVDGDTHPANNTAPLKLEITGTAPAGHAVPPVPAGPAPSSASSAAARDSRTRDIVLAAAASLAALALATALLLHRRRNRRATAPRRPGNGE